MTFATSVTWVTTVGVYIKEYPTEWGNCFSVIADNGGEYRIVNFCYENLEEVIRRGLGFPFKIKLLSDKHAVLHDERIPDNWYSSSYCESCCPKELLPVNQLDTHERQIARGQRIEREHNVTIDMSKVPIL